jgi:hypothetical protein
MSTPVRQRMTQDLQLAGLSACTQDAYLRAFRQLAIAACGTATLWMVRRCRPAMETAGVGGPA